MLGTFLGGYIYSRIYIPQNVPHDIAPVGTIKSATFPTWHPDGGQNPRRPIKVFSEAVFLQKGKMPDGEYER